MHFKFKAVKSSGEKYEGVRESRDKFSLYAEIKAEGDTLITAKEIFKKTSSFSKIDGFINRVPMHQRIIFAKNLGSMLDAGLSLARALAVLEKQVKNGKLKSIITSISIDIKTGRTLSEALRPYPDTFSQLFISMVKAGEESGKLSESLIIVAAQMDGNYKLKQKIKGAMIYPAVIISIMIIIGVLMLIFVVPSVTATFKDLKIQLPFLTRILIGASDFLKNNIFISFIAVIAVSVGTYLLSISSKGKRFLDGLFLKMPVVGDLVRETNSARTARTISSLLSSGVAFAEAISITQDVVQNSFFKDILKEARIKVEKGETISSVFLSKTNICPIFIGEMMSVGEETGRLPSMLMEVALFYENSVDQKTKDLSTIVEPVLMVIIGVAVGFFALAMITPIYSLMDTI
ncbi:MAG: type II secretion system F family protein [Candidatus Paceibacterota bacterium]|jgi:type IV pilus assembly protein PilC